MTRKVEKVRQKLTGNQPVLRINEENSLTPRSLNKIFRSSGFNFPNVQFEFATFLNLIDLLRRKQRRKRMQEISLKNIF